MVIVNYQRLSSSFRVVPPEETLKQARQFAARLGISRVTDITRLDNIGVPVFSSIRPTAQHGSLCVNAGKGFAPIEAQVGAYMEAIEFALAEYGVSKIAVIKATARDVLDGQTRPDAILGFCPTINENIDLNAPLDCVKAIEILSDKEYLVPAESVFFPYRRQYQPRSYFGTSTNGLCSGNSIFEATVHGLSEVIERDIISFQMMNDTSRMVDNSSLPPLVTEIERRIERAGFKLFVRYGENSFQIPFFRATVAESDAFDPLYIFGGYGCHPSKEIAVMRAVCEAVQSRLTMIHGGRDDVINNFQRFEQMPDAERANYAERFIAQLTNSNDKIAFTQIPEKITPESDINSCFQLLVSALKENGLDKICRVVFTEPTDPVQVLRIIVPGLEFFNETAKRVGIRLRDYVRARI